MNDETPTEALDELMEASTGFATHWAEEFEEANADFTPCMFIKGANGDRVYVDLDGQFLSDELSKELLSQVVMPDVIRSVSGIAAAYLSSAWVSTRHRDEMPPTVMPSEDPDRQERVIIIGCTLTEVRFASATIERDGCNPPTLSEFEFVSDDEGKSEGRMVQALRVGLAHQG